VTVDVAGRVGLLERGAERLFGGPSGLALTPAREPELLEEVARIFRERQGAGRAAELVDGLRPGAASRPSSR